jgi:hypothetical protein
MTFFSYFHVETLSLKKNKKQPDSNTSKKNYFSSKLEVEEN